MSCSFTNCTRTPARQGAHQGAQKGANSSRPQLIADTAGPVYLVVDGHPTHRSKLVRQFVASTQGRLKLFVLPA